MKKLLVLTIVAGVLGLSGLGCNKGDTKNTAGTKTTSETKMSGGSTKM